MDISPAEVARLAERQQTGQETSKKAHTSLHTSAHAAPATDNGNPYFDNAERAPVELGQLLLQLPRYGSQIGRGDKDGVQRAAAAVNHAENAKTTLLYGLESLGKCLFVANAGDGYRMNENEMANMGCFIQHIAIELQMLDGVIEEFRDVAKECL